MPTILLVEDDDDIRECVAAILRDDGFEVAEAKHGVRALELLETLPEPPCLVLLDVMMPIMSGPELLSTLEKTGRLASLPVVVVSAGGNAESVPQAQRFLRKPPSIPLLLDIVHEFCPIHARGRSRNSE